MHLDGYQPFLFFARFFLGFGRHIGFFGAGGKLAAAIPSLRACLHEDNSKMRAGFVTGVTFNNCGFATVPINN